jgi:hypothetical protein
MSLRMGRMTKRNRAKYRRRAYEAGTRAAAAVRPAAPPRDEATDGSRTRRAD